MQSTTDTRLNLTNTNISKLSDEQREALESMINSRVAAREWRIRVTKRKVSYLKNHEEVFFLCSTVSTCERAICHWNMTVGDDADRRLMDAVVRCRKLSPAMKATIEVAFDNAFVREGIVKAGKTYLDVYAWTAAVAVDRLNRYHQDWDHDVILEEAAYAIGGGGYEPTEAEIEFVAAAKHANRAASEGRVLAALAALH